MILPLAVKTVTKNKTLMDGMKAGYQIGKAYELSDKEPRPDPDPPLPLSDRKFHPPLFVNCTSCGVDYAACAMGREGAATRYRCSSCMGQFWITDPPGEFRELIPSVQGNSGADRADGNTNSVDSGT